MCVFQISWILIEYGIYPWQLYLSRILAGLGSGGAFTLVPIFIAEISESQYVFFQSHFEMFLAT